MIWSRELYRKGHLSAKWSDPNPATIPFTGLQRMELGSEKENLIYVPKTYDTARPAGLAVMLHGAGGNAAHGMSLLEHYADSQNIILVAPASRDYSWDLIADNAFGTDVVLIDKALEVVLGQFAINPARVAIGGFSDGASYALCIGLGNGDLFSHIIAFSPGFAYWVDRRGKPAVFISHGTQDGVLPIHSCSRRIVPRLQQQNLAITYQEFDGEHILPAHIAQAAVHWFKKD